MNYKFTTVKTWINARKTKLASSYLAGSDLLVPQWGAAKTVIACEVTSASFFAHRKFPCLPRGHTGKMSSLDVDEFLQQNRAVAEQTETYRGYWESEKHWQARREFILRNFSDFEPPQVDQLLSLSMVWANNVFLGCRCVNKTKRSYGLLFTECVLWYKLRGLVCGRLVFV